MFTTTLYTNVDCSDGTLLGIHCTYRHSFSDIIEIQNTQQIIHFLFAIDFNGDGGRCTRLEDNHIQ